MQNARLFRHLAVCIIIVLPLLYLYWVWDTLPATMPLHYNIHGEVDRVGGKQEFMTGILIICAVNLGTYLLIANIHKIDPKRIKADQTATFNKLAIGVSMFLTVVSIIIIMSGVSGDGSIISKAMLPVVGLLLAFIGNYMNNIKPNYFAGIRIPWTLNDPENWKQTHRLASHVWMAGGIMICIASLITPIEVASTVMTVVVAIMVIIPVGYSYSLSRKTKSI